MNLLQIVAVNKKKKKKHGKKGNEQLGKKSPTNCKKERKKKIENYLKRQTREKLDL